MDPLSAILRTLIVDRAIPLLFESSGPYAMRFDGYEHLKFGAILTGGMSLQVDGGEVVTLTAGDCYLLTDGRPYRTFNDTTVTEIDGSAFFAARRDADGVVRLGDGPPDKIVIGGRFVFEPAGIAWLRAALPPLVLVHGDAAPAAALRATLTLLRQEMTGTAPGQATAIDHLAGLLLVQAIRAHLAAGSPRTVGWLAGLADPRLGRAMRAFHDDVGAPWTVASLAAAAGMSRSTFAARFQTCVGLAPLDYVTRWRLHQVHGALIDSDRPFALIAADNGYRSRTSCSQAFRRVYGRSPTSLRAGASVMPPSA